MMIFPSTVDAPTAPTAPALAPGCSNMPPPTTPAAVRPAAPAALRAIQPPPFAHLVPRPLNLAPAVAPGGGLVGPPAPALQPVPAQVPLPVPVVAAGAGPVVEVNQPHVDLAAYLVSVVHSWSEFPAARTGRGRPPTSKKTQVTKSDRMRVETMTRVEFATAALSVHDLEDQFSASPIRGFPFKMWYTGSRGGKSTAPTIEDDAEFALILDQLKLSKKTPSEITVFISFDTDTMDAFRNRKRARDIDLIPADAGPGTKVPRLGDLDAGTLLHGDFILKLKQTHSCEEHRGEHGEVGYCYVWPNGQHLGLNNRRFAMWAAAMAAGEATRHAPPNAAEFDGNQGNGTVAPKPRGRVPAAAAQVPAPSSSSDASSLLVAAMIPLLTSLTQSAMGSAHAAPPPDPRPAPEPVPRAPVQAPAPTPALPEVKFTEAHILDCILAFKEESGIDLGDKVAALQHRDLTPDLIREVPLEHLATVLGVSEGKAIKYHIFCRHWVHGVRLKQKAE
ncbi:hypothetical protein FRC09_012180 [Ceratobasidium sp. 395]|nr:hypothetical protein FRC09_012180 [Ceratobasidium sp. 395]